MQLVLALFYCTREQIHLRLHFLTSSINFIVMGDWKKDRNLKHLIGKHTCPLLHKFLSCGTFTQNSKKMDKYRERKKAPTQCRERCKISTNWFKERLLFPWNPKVLFRPRNAFRCYYCSPSNSMSLTAGDHSNPEHTTISFPNLTSSSHAIFKKDMLKASKNVSYDQNGIHSRGHEFSLVKA